MVTWLPLNVRPSPGASTPSGPAVDKSSRLKNSFGAEDSVDIVASTTGVVEMFRMRSFWMAQEKDDWRINGSSTMLEWIMKRKASRREIIRTWCQNVIEEEEEF
jgi:hypothetical protein